MSSFKSLSYFIFCLTLSSCAITKQTIDETNVIYDKDYFKSQKNEAWLTSKRTAISFAKGDANNCKGYLELVKDSEIEESAKYQLIKSEYIECEVLNLVKNSHAKTIEYQNTDELDGDIGKVLAEKLDLTSFNSSLGQLTLDNKKTLATIFPNTIRQHKNSLTIEDESRHFNLLLVAKAYINNNQHSDWILIVSDEILDGTYRSFATIIIIDPETSQQSLLKAKSFLDIQKN